MGKLLATASVLTLVALATATPASAQREWEPPLVETPATAAEVEAPMTSDPPVPATPVVTSSPRSAPFFAVDSTNCGNYPFQEDAQAALDADPSDPNNLDGDNDGIACEDNPRRGAVVPTTIPGPPSTTVAPVPTSTTLATTTTTVGTTTTTTTSMADTGASVGRTSLTGVAMVVGGSAMVALSRRKERG